MKILIYAGIILMLLSSCNKSLIRTDTSGFNELIKKELSDSVSPTVLKQLDLDRLIKNTLSDGHIMVRIPMPKNSQDAAFVLLLTEQNARIIAGKIVTAKRNVMTPEDPSDYNGVLSVTTLNSANTVTLTIAHGHTVIPGSAISRTRSHADNSLPTVVVTGYRHRNNELSFHDYINVLSLLSVSPSACLYASMDPWTAGYGGDPSDSGNTYGGGGSSGSELYDPMILDFEPSGDEPGIDVEKFVKCFAKLPDAGSVCSMEIYADLPVDNDPEKFYNFKTGSPGHSFLRISKSYGSQTVDQFIGFYPNVPWHSLTAGEVESKCLSNSRHEYNASMKMSLTPQELHTVLAELHSTAVNYNYDLDDYNCTDFALQVFNSVRLFKAVEIPRRHIPGTVFWKDSNTPQGLFVYLRDLKASSSPEASNVILPSQKAYVGDSHGPCN